MFLIVFYQSILGQGFKFAAMSDSRGSYNGINEPVLSALITHLTETQPEVKFVVFAGDMVDGNKTDPEKTFNDLLNWKNVMAPVYNNPNMVWPYLWPVVGNHEIRHRKDEENFRRAFPDVFMNGPDDEKGLSYSFDYMNAHFVIINSDRWFYGDPKDTTDDRRDWHYIKHLDWMEEDLKAAKSRGAEHIFTFAHEMPFPIGGHLRDGLPNLGMKLTFPLDSTRLWYLEKRDRFWELLITYGVEAHICGHEHLYGRESVNGVYQIISGSSGAPLYYFNPLFGENDREIKPGFEFIYNEAVPYYEVLKYNHGPGENSQKSEDFLGKRCFNYVVFDVQRNYIKVETFGAPPKEGTNSILGGSIEKIDEFMIYK